jgi:hypothetical protein
MFSDDTGLTLEALATDEINSQEPVSNAGRLEFIVCRERLRSLSGFGDLLIGLFMFG